MKKNLRESGRPRFVFQWHITDACDQRCKHCYIYAENSGKAVETMALPQMRQVLAKCLNFCEHLGYEPYFCITGGDPLLHPNFWELAELLHQLKISFTILGNPFHLTDKVCARLKKLGCKSYQLSIDGLEKTHDALRKPGSYRETVEKIAMIAADVNLKTIEIGPGLGALTEMLLKYSKSVDAYEIDPDQFGADSYAIIRCGAMLAAGLPLEKAGAALRSEDVFQFAIPQAVTGNGVAEGQVFMLLKNFVTNLKSLSADGTRNT